MDSNVNIKLRGQILYDLDQLKEIATTHQLQGVVTKQYDAIDRCEWYPTVKSIEMYNRSYETFELIKGFSVQLIALVSKPKLKSTLTIHQKINLKSHFSNDSFANDKLRVRQPYKTRDHSWENECNNPHFSERSTMNRHFTKQDRFNAKK